MKNQYRYKLGFLIFVFTLLFLVGCNNKAVEEDLVNKEEMNIYFINQVDGKLVAEKIFTNPKETDTNEKKVQVAIQALQKGPQSTSLLAVIPSDITIKNVTLHDNGAKVGMTGDYESLSVQEQMILRASIVRTLTNISSINWVEFLVEDQPLLSTGGDVIGPIYRDDIILAQPDPKPPTNVQNIVLYFSDDQAQELVAENRKIQVSNNVPIERYIVEELIKGPQNKNNIPTVPPETIINDIKTKDGVCHIDLSAEFKTKHSGGSTGELFTVYSIVNSLTESSPRVKKVSFLIDGKKQVEFKGHLDLSILFERDESLIVQE